MSYFCLNFFRFFLLFFRPVKLAPKVSDCVCLLAADCKLNSRKLLNDTVTGTGFQKYRDTDSDINTDTFKITFNLI